METDLPAHLRPDMRGFGRTYWESAQRGELSMPRCLGCGSLSWPPRQHCPRCGSTTIDWFRVSGRGSVHTFTVVRQGQEPYFKARVPYVVAMVALEEGPRVMTSVIGCDVESVRIGMPVVVAFVDAGGGFMLPVFKPDGSVAE